MDLLKEEKKLVEKKHKAFENLERKQKYLTGAVTSFKKARRELKAANIRLRVMRRQIKMEGIERPTIMQVYHPGDPGLGEENSE